MQQSGEGYALFLDRNIYTLQEYDSFSYYALGVVAVEWSRVCHLRPTCMCHFKMLQHAMLLIAYK